MKVQRNWLVEDKCMSSTLGIASLVSKKVQMSGCTAQML
jgi:hypothetical protein